MGNLVFQATLGGQVNLVGPNTASTFNINVPTVNGNMVTTGDTGTVTNTMCATSVYTAPGTIGSGTPNTGAFTTLSATGVATFSAGSASAPAITTSGDTNTGIFFPAADTVGITTGGTERARVDSSGNLGLGVTPSAWLSTNTRAVQVGTMAMFSQLSGQNADLTANAYYSATGYKYTTSDYATKYQQISGQHQWHIAASGTAGNAITFTQAMTLDASGNLGLGTTTIAAGYFSGNGSLTLQNAKSLAFNNSSNAWSTTTTGGAITYFTDNNLYIDAKDSTSSIVLRTNGATERARIDSSGNFSTSSGSIKAATFVWAAGGSAGFRGYYLGSGTDNGCISQGSQGTGTVTTYIGNQSITTVSDIRLKENIVDTTRNALDLVDQLRVVDHTWNDPSDQCENNRNSRGTWMGLIAQEAQPIVPWLVNKPTEDVNEDGSINPWTMDFGYAVPLLVKAIQEQQAIITALTARIEALEQA